MLVLPIIFRYVSNSLFLLSALHCEEESRFSVQDTAHRLNHRQRECWIAHTKRWLHNKFSEAVDAEMSNGTFLETCCYCLARHRIQTDVPQVWGQLSKMTGWISLAVFWRDPSSNSQRTAASDHCSISAYKASGVTYHRHPISFGREHNFKMKREKKLLLRTG